MLIPWHTYFDLILSQGMKLNLQNNTYGTHTHTHNIKFINSIVVVVVVEVCAELTIIERIYVLQCMNNYHVYIHYLFVKFHGNHNV